MNSIPIRIIKTNSILNSVKFEQFILINSEVFELNWI